VTLDVGSTDAEHAGFECRHAEHSDVSRATVDDEVGFTEIGARLGG